MLGNSSAGDQQLGKSASCESPPQFLIIQIQSGGCVDVRRWNRNEFGNYSMASYYPQEWKLRFPRRQRGMNEEKILFLLYFFSAPQVWGIFVKFEGWFIYPFECHVFQLNHFGRNSTWIKDSLSFPFSSFSSLCKCHWIRYFPFFFPPKKRRNQFRAPFGFNCFPLYGV